MCQDEYYQFPKWLLEAELNNTERIVYMLILDRARLSQRSGYHKGGNCYGIITAREISERVGIGVNTARDAIRNLKLKEMISAQDGRGVCSWYFPKLPDGSYAVPYRNSGRGTTEKPVHPYRKTVHNAPTEISDTSNNKITSKKGGDSPDVAPAPSEEVRESISPEEAAAKFRAIFGEEWM